MRINNKGFTLVELLAVLVIIALIGAIAIPNVISIADNNRKDLMLQDAMKFVSLAKAEIVKDRVFRDNPNVQTKEYTLATLDQKKLIVTDPDDGLYNRDNSKVKYTKSVGYCVYLEGSKRIIKASKTNSACLQEELLSNRAYVFDK
jgi:type IV pilus assembly protein PilA